MQYKLYLLRLLGEFKLKRNTNKNFKCAVKRFMNLVLRRKEQEEGV